MTALFGWLDALDAFGQTPEGMMRLAFSPAEKAAKEYTALKMRKLGMLVRWDAAQNLIGRWEGSDPELPAVAIGSHLDSVPCGGRFDGTLGVLSSMEAVRQLREENFQPKHAVEILAFSNEEGVRYLCTLFGSSVMMGDFHKTLAEMENDFDADGISLAEAIRLAGGRPEELSSARRTASDFKAYLELHIEQGRVLEDQGKSIGIVTGIAAPWRAYLTLTGRADHAGATPMNLRSDALSGAAEVILALEQIALRAGPPAVGTVGRLSLAPDAINIVPGKATLSFDLRDTRQMQRDAMASELREAVETICAARGLAFEWVEKVNLAPVQLDPNITELIEQTCTQLQLPAMRLASGATHDASVMATHMPTGMIFVPSVAGISHSPAEKTSPDDILAGVAVLKEMIRRLGS